MGRVVRYISVAFEDGSRWRVRAEEFCAGCLARLAESRARKPGYGMTEESRETTELMTSLRVDERLTLDEIGEICGVTREAVRLRLKKAGVEFDWRKPEAVPVLTVGRFAKCVRRWVEESGSWYCSCGRHVVSERRAQMCRECNTSRVREYWTKKHPNAVTRTPAQVERMRRGRWGY